MSRLILSEQNFDNFLERGPFSKKRKNSKFFQRLATSGRHNSAMIIDRRKFITKWSLYGSLVSIFTVGLNSKSFPWPVHSVQDTSPNFLRRETLVKGTKHNTDDLIGRCLMTSLGHGHAHLDSRTDSRALQAEYCIVGIPHNTAI